MDVTHSAVAFVNIRKEHDFDLPTLPEEISRFVREFFAGASISRDLLDKVVKFCEDVSQQILLGDVVWGPQFRRDNCPRRSSNRNALKYIIEQLQARDIQIEYQLFSCLAESMMDDVHYLQRIYFDELFSKKLILQESRYQLSQGTTGLSCWQGSCDLANYLLKFGRDFISGCDVLELGAGCGLVGIALAAAGFAKSVTLSDGNDDVLCLIRDNIQKNLLKDSGTPVNVISLGWEGCNEENLPVVPNVIVASDVVYDSSTAILLARAIKRLLAACTIRSRSYPCCILANTLRNRDTLDKFLICTEENELVVKEHFVYQDSFFIFDTGKIKDESLFPFTSNVFPLDLPTAKTPEAVQKLARSEPSRLLG